MQIILIKKAPSPLSPHYAYHGTKFDRAKSTIFAHPELVCSDKIIRLNLSEISSQCRFITGCFYYRDTVYKLFLLHSNTFILFPSSLNPFNLLNHPLYLFIIFRQVIHLHTVAACPHRFSTIPFSYPIILGNNQAAPLLHKLCTALLTQKFL